MASANGFRIIVIDDNPEIYHDFVKILASSAASTLDRLSTELFGVKTTEFTLPQFKIDSATQGQEGVTLIEKAINEKQPYALAFVDIRMPPGWDGIETIKRIWQIDQDIQIVICTAYSDYSWEETISNLGQTDNLLILKKPFDNIAVRQLACALTKKWQLIQDARQTSSRHSKLERELQHQATHDALTRLPNRVLLLERLRQTIKNSDQENIHFALLFIDLDRFKLINDSLSHAVGDELLQAVAGRLLSIIRPEDTLARLGGDEFVIVIANLAKEEQIVAKADRVLKIFQEPFRVAGRDLMITASIGISFYPKDGKSADVLLRNADAVMYQAKIHGANNFQFYSTEMHEQSEEKLNQEAQLQEAITKGEFFLYYQPQFDLLKQNVTAVEALLRWNHPQKGVVLPLDFIPLAEETGLVVAIGEWALRTACAQNKAWQDAGLPPVRIAVNITAQQFKQPNLSKMVNDILKETQLKPEYLELELTESVILNDAEVIEVIHELKSLGITITVDDFGTGYASLNFLKKVPLDRLKIDGSFIQHIKSTGDDEVIIRAIIAMAKNLGLTVLAEGVETQNQLNFLKNNDCSEAQGFYFSKPLPKEELESLLKKTPKFLD